MSTTRSFLLVSALLLLANFGQLGMANGLIRFLPAAGRHAAGLLARTYTLSACWSAVLGLGFILLAPRLSPEFSFLDDRLFPGLALSGAVLVWALFALQDAAIVGLRHAVWIPLENGAYGLLKLGLLLPFAAVMPGVGVFAAWVLAAAALIIPVNYAIFRRWMPSHAQQRPLDRGSIEPSEVSPGCGRGVAAALCWPGSWFSLPSAQPQRSPTTISALRRD